MKYQDYLDIKELVVNGEATVNYVKEKLNVPIVVARCLVKDWIEPITSDIPDQGHGSIVLHLNEDGSFQLRDNLSRMWCACGKPAVHYFDYNLPPYQFKCIKCGLEESE